MTKKQNIKKHPYSWEIKDTDIYWICNTDGVYTVFEGEEQHCSFDNYEEAAAMAFDVSGIVVDTSRLKNHRRNF